MALSVTRATEPRLLLICILGPGATSLRRSIKDHIPLIGHHLGELTHLIVLGDPRNREDHFEDHLIKQGIDLGSWNQQWQDRLDDRGSPAAVVNYEEMRLSEILGLPLQEAPWLLLAAPHDPAVAQRVHLERPLWADREHEVSRVIIDAFKESRIAARLEELSGSNDNLAAVLAGLLRDVLRRLSSGSIERLGLNPTDFKILACLFGQHQRRLTGWIARAVDQEAKTIGKNLSRLGQLGLVHNIPRKGYLLTPKGILVAESQPQAP